MNKNVETIFQESSNGIITSSQFTNAGLHRNTIQSLVNNGKLNKYTRGIYVKTDAWEDDLYLLQQRYKKGIYSHETALYLLGFSDRVPIKYIMTFPKGYNSPSIKNENVTVVRVILDNYGFGTTTITTSYGNTIQIYDLERSLCDIVRGNKGDIQIINSAMKRYSSYRNRDINKLMNYAERLGVKSKVLRYMEVLL